MFNHTGTKSSHVVKWVELDGIESEVSITDHAQERVIQRDIHMDEVFKAVESLEGAILSMRLGDVRELVSNSTGVTIVIDVDSAIGTYHTIVNVHTVYRNANYMRVKKFR